jgi:hypothetical protein
VHQRLNDLFKNGNMKARISTIAILMFSLALSISCGTKASSKATADGEKLKVTQVISNGIRFCESVLPYNGGLLIANFGSSQLNPLNHEGKGYILYYKDGQVKPFIPADGNLNAPKGMCIAAGKLFVSDVGKIAVYDISDLKAVPATIKTPKGDFVNDIVAIGGTLYVSVTDADMVYTIDISSPESLPKMKMRPFRSLSAPNGLATDGTSLYVALYPDGGDCVCKISDLDDPHAFKISDTKGQYDGIAVSGDRKTVYVTNWDPIGVFAIDVKSGKMSRLEIDADFKGAADMSLVGDTLYIPDLPASKVLEVPLK